MGLLAGALRRRTCSLHGWQEKEEEIEEGDSRQRAFSSGCCIAGCRGAAGVIAHGTTAVGALRLDSPSGALASSLHLAVRQWVVAASERRRCLSFADSGGL